MFLSICVYITFLGFQFGVRGASNYASSPPPLAPWCSKYYPVVCPWPFPSTLGIGKGQEEYSKRGSVKEGRVAG